MQITPQFIDFALTAFYLLLFLTSIAVVLIRILDPGSLPTREAVVYGFREKRNRLKDALFMRNLKDPATFTLYNDIWYGDKDQ